MTSSNKMFKHECLELMSRELNVILQKFKRHPFSFRTQLAIFRALFVWRERPSKQTHACASIKSRDYIQQIKTLRMAQENSVLYQFPFIKGQCSKRNGPAMLQLCVYRVMAGYTWEVGRALEKLEKHSASPRAIQTLLSCSPNFPRASITQLALAKHNHFLIRKVS